MGKKTKLALLILLALLIAFFVVRQSMGFYRSVRSIRLPDHQSRQLSEMGIYSRMSPERLARKTGKPVEAVFRYIGITPQPGDEKLSLGELRKKYGKTREEMLKGLEDLIKSSPQAGGGNE